MTFLYFSKRMNSPLREAFFSLRGPVITLLQPRRRRALPNREKAANDLAQGTIITIIDLCQSEKNTLRSKLMSGTSLVNIPQILNRKVNVYIQFKCFQSGAGMSSFQLKCLESNARISSVQFQCLMSSSNVQPLVPECMKFSSNV